jgi:hypothetical protein
MDGTVQVMFIGPICYTKFPDIQKRFLWRMKRIWENFGIEFCVWEVHDAQMASPRDICRIGQHSSLVFCSVLNTYLLNINCLYENKRYSAGGRRLTSRNILHTRVIVYGNICLPSCWLSKGKLLWHWLQINVQAELACNSNWGSAKAGRRNTKSLY